MLICLLLGDEVGDHAADAADLLVCLDGLRDLHRHEVHRQQQRRDQSEFESGDAAPVRKQSGDCGPPAATRTNVPPHAQTSSYLPAMLRVAKRNRHQSSNGSFCQVTVAKCSVLPSLRFDIDLRMKSVITGHL